MDVLIKNAVILTGKDQNSIFTDGAIAIHGTKITAVGDSSELVRRYEDLQCIDARGKAILPGFINSHTHSVLTVLRGTVEDMGGDAIYGYMSPISFAMTAEDRQAMSALGCLEAIRSGITTMVDPFRHVYTYAESMANSGLRLFLSESCADALTLEIRQGSYVYSETWGQKFLDRTKMLIEQFHGLDNGRVQCQIAAHAPDNCSPWMLRKLFELSDHYGLRRTVHLSQSMVEKDQVLAAHGCSSTEYLGDNGWLGQDVLAAHWFYCSDKDIETLAKTGTHMAHCPAPSFRTGRYPLPNMSKIIDSGVNVTLGTDNMSENMFQALNVGLILNRGLLGGFKPLPQTMLNWATANGSFALGMESDLGTIEPGKMADIVVIDMNRSHLVPAINPLSNIVHYGEMADVESVMVAGTFVMLNGEVLTLDEEKVIVNARKATIRAWERLGQQFSDIDVPDYPGWNMLRSKT